MGDIGFGALARSRNDYLLTVAIFVRYKMGPCSIDMDSFLRLKFGRYTQSPVASTGSVGLGRIFTKILTLVILTLLAATYSALRGTVTFMG
jgi:hypothetical protein